MLSSVIRHGGEAGVCGSCLDARGIADKELVDGAKRSNLAEMTDWVIWADKIISF